MARLTPEDGTTDRLSALAAYLDSLPAAWADATPEQRNRLVNLIYEEICVDGPVVEYVKPRPDLEPLFQIRTGATQPVRCLSHANVGRGDPDGEPRRMCQWDFLVDEPLPQSVRRAFVERDLDTIAQRVGQGESLRAIASDYEISHETLRQTLAPRRHPGPTGPDVPGVYGA